MSKLPVVLGIVGGIAGSLYLLQRTAQAAPAVTQTAAEPAPAVPEIVPPQTPAVSQPQQPITTPVTVGPVPTRPGPVNVVSTKAFSENNAEIKITWSRVPEADYYLVHHKDEGVIANVADNNLSLVGLNSDSPYTVAVSACNDNGCSAPGPWSELRTAAYRQEPVSVTVVQEPPQVSQTPVTQPKIAPPQIPQQPVQTVPATPGPPRIIPEQSSASSSTDATITIGWDRVPGATAYEIYHMGEGRIGKVTGTNLTLKVRNLFPDSPYTVFIFACNDAGCSNPGPERTLRTPAYQQPAAPQQPAPSTPAPALAPTPVQPQVPGTPGAPWLVSSKAHSATNADLTISWDAVSGATYYMVWHQGEGEIAKVNSNRYTLIGAYPDSDLTVAIIACNDNGCSSRGPIVKTHTAAYQ